MRILPYFLSFSLFASTCLSAPISGEVIRGSSDISYGPSRVEVSQHTDRAVIDWRSFDVKAGEHVKFNLPNPSSVSLNRINDIKASEINGLVSSNANLILLNPNGIVFGKDAVIDAAGIIASSSKVNIDEFMNGGAFGFASDNAGKIINKGKISAKDHGLVGLVSPHLENHGVISAKLGKVQLASSDSYTVDLAGDGLINLAISDHHKQRIENSGKINADSGRILLTASAARDIIDSLIINNGKLEAKTGSIKLYAEGANAVSENVAANKGIKAGQSTIINNGVIDASGKLKGQRGGNIELLADDIALLDNSKIEASGHTGALNTYKDKAISDVREAAAGGDVKIGGNYLGKGNIPAARNIYVAPNAKIYADSLDSGDAGRVIIWADKQNDFYGNVFARGGKTNGDGGFVETSGKEKLNAKGYVTTLAAKGKRGTYLLDPTSIAIYGATGNWPKFVSTDSTVNLNTSLLLWFDASDPLNTGTPPANNTLIDPWYDKSGNGNNLVGSRGVATWLSNQQNGLGSIGFDNTGYPGWYDTGTNGFPVSHDYSIFVNLLRTTNTADAVYGDRDWQHSLAFGSTLRVSLKNNTSVTSNTDLPLNTPGIILATYKESGHTGTLYQNSVNVGSATLSSQTSSSTQIGGTGGAYDYFTGGVLFETMLYGATLSTSARNILEQYNSAKWAVALTPPGTSYQGSTESLQAMASLQRTVGNGFGGTDTGDGYSVFTTRYLERLAASSDISLVSGSGGINLDLQGDTLTLPSEVNFSLTTTSSGDITANSTGTIVSTRTSSKGNITLNSAGNINFTSPMTFKTKGGDFTLSAGGTASVNTLKVDTTNNGALTTGNITINKAISASAGSGNSIILAAGNNFINNVGSGVFTTSGTARYLVYSSNPANNTPAGTPTGVSKQYGVTYPTAPGTSSMYLYTVVPQLTATADNQSMTYGSAVPTLTFSVTGNIDGDDITTLYTGAPGVSATSSSSAGTYPITFTAPGTFALAATATNLGYNATVNYTNGTLTINKATLTIASQTGSSTYGTTPSTNSLYLFTGFVNGDTSAVVSGFTGSTTIDATTSTGVHAFHPTAATASNYTITLDATDHNWTVNKAALTIASQVGSSACGTTPSTNSLYLFTGFVNGDTSAVVSGITSSTTIDINTVGVYQFHPTAATASNYTITLDATDHNWTVNKAALTIKAYNGSSVYGSPPSTAQMFSYTGFYNGDTYAVLDLSGLSSSITITPSTTLGTYAYNAVGSVPSTANYNVTVDHTAANWTVSQVPLTIQADNKFKYYNYANPQLTYKVLGLIDGDQPTVVSNINLVTNAVTNSMPGTYSITFNAPTPTVALPYYTIGSTVNGVLTVVQPSKNSKCPCLSRIGH